jgi:hypothetical protein
MRILRGIGRWLWRFMIIFSFIVNFILVLVLLLAGLFIFEIKNQVADPLIGGLHSTAVGLDEATIDWVIPVRDNLGIALVVPINENTITSEVREINGQPVVPITGETIVTLTRDVPITITNALIQSNDLTLRNATVNITLPANTQLPVALNLEVGLEAEIPVSLDVRAVIPLQQTQLHDPIQQLALLFEPLAIGLYNLPNDFNQAGDFVGQIWNGAPLDTLLLAEDGTGFNPEAYDAWTGFSSTAGYNYPLFTEQYPPQLLPLQTGIVVPGGIPALDALLPRRAELYANDNTPQDVNAQAVENLQTDPNINPATYNGDFSNYYDNIQTDIQGQQATDN